MDMQKIGQFLKELRKEKGLTQEQLAEILGVAGRTVSRWENASNMPDLSLLLEIAEFYDVELKEILDGERENKNMDKEIKETLTKVADYSKAEKDKVAKIGYLAFVVTVFVGVVSILIQYVMLMDFRYIIGETAVLLVGIIAAIVMSVHNGLWGVSLKNQKGSVLSDVAVSVAISAVFSCTLAVLLYRMSGNISGTFIFALCFFVGCALIGFAVLRGLASLSKKRKEKIDSPVNKE